MAIADEILAFLASAQQRVMTTVPYCSASAYYYLAGSTPHEVFGDNCLRQAQILRDTLSLPETYFLRDERQFTLIVNLNGQLIYLNPYLLHKDPILIEGKTRNESLPVVMLRKRLVPSQVRTQLDVSGRYLTVSKKRFHVGVGVVKSTYTYDLRDKIDNPPLWYDPALIIHPEQTTLSIRTTDVPKGTVTHLVYPVSSTHGEGIIDEQFLYIKTNAGLKLSNSDLGFAEELEKMSALIGCNSGDTVRFLMGGVERYDRLVPRTLHYQSTNPNNQ